MIERLALISREEVDPVTVSGVRIPAENAQAVLQLADQTFGMLRRQPINPNARQQILEHPRQSIKMPQSVNRFISGITTKQLVPSVAGQRDTDVS